MVPGNATTAVGRGRKDIIFVVASSAALLLLATAGTSATSSSSSSSSSPIGAEECNSEIEYCVQDIFECLSCVVSAQAGIDVSISDCAVRYPDSFSSSVATSTSPTVTADGCPAAGAMVCCVFEDNDEAEECLEVDEMQSLVSCQLNALAPSCSIEDLPCYAGSVLADSTTPAPTYVAVGSTTPAPVSAVGSSPTPAPAAAVLDSTTPAPTSAVISSSPTTLAPFVAVDASATPTPAVDALESTTPVPSSLVGVSTTPAPSASVRGSLATSSGTTAAPSASQSEEEAAEAANGAFETTVSSSTAAIAAAVGLLAIVTGVLVQ